MLILHYTGMETAEAALMRLCDPAAKVSAHYVVDEDGTVTRLVAEEMRAWHAGESCWRGATNINDRSIGIELVKDGRTRESYPENARIGHRVTMEARRRGVMLRPLSDVIVLMPPLSITVQEIVELLNVAYWSIVRVTGAPLAVQ